MLTQFKSYDKRDKIFTILCLSSLLLIIITIIILLIAYSGILYMLINIIIALTAAALCIIGVCIGAAICMFAGFGIDFLIHPFKFKNKENRLQSFERKRDIFRSS